MRPLLDWIKDHPELASLAGAWLALSIVNALTPHWTTKHPTWKRVLMRGLEWLAWFPSLRAAAGRGPLFWLKLPGQDIAPAPRAGVKP
jgi:hypothetical protein